MATRVVYGNAFSLNNWPMVDEGSCVWVKVPGTSVTLQIREGQPASILGAFAADYNAYVEPLRDADSACWTPTNSVPTSNHLSGTAMDLNWGTHPFQVSYAGFDTTQIDTIRDLLAWYEGMVWWGQDWTTPKDPMHWEMQDDTYGAANVKRVQSFIDRKIRVDGYSTYKRDAGPVAAQTLAKAMGNRLSIERYEQLLPAVRESLKGSDCTNVNRIAMWCAQIGHESGGLYYTEEIASGSAYEGRTDLGNTQPGDGVRFKGRSWIQITGRSNYTRLSQWAWARSLVPTPTYFVDNPAMLSSDQYAGLGAAWYWVVARADINELSDKRDVVAVTQRINGGQNGIGDRRARYNVALGMGDALLTLLADEVEEEDFMAALTDAEQRELLAGVRWLKDQLGPNLWGPSSSFGTDEAGAELTMRDGLAAMKRAVELGEGGSATTDQLSELARQQVVELAKSLLETLSKTDEPEKN